MQKTKSLEISINDQKLRLVADGVIEREYIISTAKNGPGEKMDSECTPRGLHKVSEKIGSGCAPGTVFVGREQTGEIYQPDLRQQYPDRDWILTRILWLDGQEDGINRGGNVDSHDRYIYIHGSPDDVPMGIPGSRGCIRMRNQDVIELFEIVDINTPVIIKENWN